MMVKGQGEAEEKKTHSMKLSGQLKEPSAGKSVARTRAGRACSRPGAGGSDRRPRDALEYLYACACACTCACVCVSVCVCTHA